MKVPIEYKKLLNPIWNYLSIRLKPKKADVIFLFGSAHLATPPHAAVLFHKKYAPYILVTGSVGDRSQSMVGDKSEAEVFRRILKSKRVQSKKILIETHATNTLENVRYGMKVLEKHNLLIRSAILVNKPWDMRRAVATFNRQFPQVDAMPVPPSGGLEKWIDRPLDEFAQRMIDELKRLEKYSKKGDIKRTLIPRSITLNARRLQSLLDNKK